MPINSNHEYKELYFEDSQGRQFKLKDLRDAPVLMSMFDEEEVHENCTVQILRNSITGEMSLGWWQN